MKTRSKTCIGCYEALPLARFNRYPQGVYGRRARCKSCQAIQRKTSADRTAKKLALESKGKRQCSKCGKKKALSSYQLAKRTGRKPTRSGICKPCVSQRQKKNHLTKNQEIRLFIYNYKKQHPCKVCGETDVEMLEFDHRHSKKFDISNGVGKGVSMHLLKKELAKCVVLCSNHHRKKTHAENNTWLHRLAKEGIN
jgi:hypothetical protein